MPAQESLCTRICLVEDQQLVRAGIASLIAGQPGTAVVASCGTVQEAIGAVTRVPVDLIVLDFHLGSENGLSLLTELVSAHFSGRVLVMADSLSDLEVFQLACHGVAGIVMKTAAPELLLNSIRKAAQGELCYSQRDLETILTRAAGLLGERQSETFTPREKLVLQHIVDGLSNKEIALRIGSRESSVKSLIQRLFSKAGVRSRGQLVRVAFERFQRELLQQQG